MWRAGSAMDIIDVIMINKEKEVGWYVKYKRRREGKE